MTDSEKPWTTSRAINSSDLVAAYQSNPRISKAIAVRLATLTNEHEPYDFGDLQRIITEENARNSPKYSHEREI
ncbi:hypothetical protein HAP94_08440 [Acidithiobacillus ferrivorans]|nr:hypothetical protein [Acidithiobacillus ferrivorans]